MERQRALQLGAIEMGNCCLCQRVDAAVQSGKQVDLFQTWPFLGPKHEEEKKFFQSRTSESRHDCHQAEVSHGKY